MDIELEFKPSPLNPMLVRDREGHTRKARISSKEIESILGYSKEELIHLIKIKHILPCGVTAKSRKSCGVHRWKFSTVYIYQCCQDIEWMDEAERHLWKMYDEKGAKGNGKKSFSIVTTE